MIPLGLSGGDQASWMAREEVAVATGGGCSDGAGRRVKEKVR